MKTVILLGATWMVCAVHAAPVLESLVVEDATFRQVTLRKDYPQSVLLEHADGRVVLEKTKLSDEDLGRLGASHASGARSSSDASGAKAAARPPAKTTFDIEVAGATVEVTRWGDGPVGVIFFPASESYRTTKAILATSRWYEGLVPGKCSFFVWNYPTKRPPFNQTWAATRDYFRGDAKKLRPDFRGIAGRVLDQIRKETALADWLLVGNSMGAGVILWDYDTLAEDPRTSFLLVSPAESFMPPVSTLGNLERTMLIASKGWKNGGVQQRSDMLLEGAEAWDWVAANLDMEAVDRLNESSVYEPEVITKRVGCVKHTLAKRTDFTFGHKVIGEDINNELLGKMIRVKLGMADYATLAQRPLQKPNPPIR